jgi:hypothetical protein
MPVNCPSCNLLFRSSNELDWHVREEHTRPRLAARTPPAEDAATPASRHGPAVTTDAARGRTGRATDFARPIRTRRGEDGSRPACMAP